MNAAVWDELIKPCLARLQESMAGLEPRQLQNGSHLGCDKFSSFKNDSYTHTHGNSLMGQWLRFWFSPLQGSKGLTPGWGTKIPHALGCQKKKKKKPNQEYTPSYHLDVRESGLFVTPVLIYWGNIWGQVTVCSHPQPYQQESNKSRQSPYPPEKDSLCHWGLHAS